jgi:hypothetical protein
MKKTCNNCENFNTMTCECCCNNSCWQKRIAADLEEAARKSINEALEKEAKDFVIKNWGMHPEGERYSEGYNCYIAGVVSEAARDYWLTDEKIKEIILDYTKWYYDMYTLPNYGTDEVIANDYIKYKNNIKKEE